ncbi:MAG: hypothetical protein U1F09_12455 [Steroidobacteraceae bacterium]
MSDRPGTMLFRAGAVFNALVGVPMLIAWPVAAGLLGIATPRSVFTDLVGAMVALFGWVYWRIAEDPVGCRSYVLLGIVGKLTFVVVIYANFALGRAPAGLAALVTADLVFAVLFARWLRRTAPAA